MEFKTIKMKYRINFDVLLTVHLSMSLVNDQLDAQSLYFTVRYMFRATSCSSSGAQIQHLIQSLTESDDTR